MLWKTNKTNFRIIAREFILMDAIVINKKRSFRIIWFYFVLLIFFKPQIAEDFRILDILFNVGSVGLTMWYSSALIIKRRRICKTWFLLCLAGTEVFLVTVLNNGIISKAVSHYFPSIGLLAFFLYYKRHIHDLCMCFVNLETVLLILNLLLFLLFPNGVVYRQESMIPVWLLGQKQDLAGFVFPFIFFSLLISEFDKKNGKVIIIRAFALSFLTLSLEQSMTALGCITVLTLMCIISWSSFFRRKNKNYYILLLAGIMGAFIIIQYIANNFNDLILLQELLNNIHTRGMSKTRTLHSRFVMWKFGWNCFVSSPLFGLGELSKETWRSGIGYYHSVMDNIYMDIITTSGLFGIIIFCYNIIKSMRYLSRRKEKTSVYAAYCLSALCIYCLLGSPFVPSVFLMFTSSCWLSYLQNPMGESYQI